MTTSIDAVHRAFEAIERADRPEVWIALRDKTALLSEAARIDARGVR